MTPAGAAQNAPLCPSWCTGAHEVTDDLRVSHRSDGVVVPGVERVVDANGSARAPSVVELTLGLEHTAGETWVWIGPDERVHRSMALSVDSARRLLRGIEELIRRAA